MGSVQEKLSRVKLEYLRILGIENPDEAQILAIEEHMEKDLYRVCINKLVREGRTNGQIANKLGLPIHTIRRIRYEKRKYKIWKS